jgi:hypothetical protein
MSPDRLAELRRQRALVAQHLAWIDSELSTAGAGQPPAPSTDAAAEANVVAPPLLPALEANQNPAVALANKRADEIIEQYRATEALDPSSTKRGCLLLIGGIFALGGAVLMAIYYFGYAR